MKIKYQYYCSIYHKNLIDFSLSSESIPVDNHTDKQKDVEKNKSLHRYNNNLKSIQLQVLEYY